jgi:hypothetical protein
MSARTVRAMSRVVFFICGVISLFTAFPFAMLRGAELPVQSEWIIFVVILAVTGLFGVTVAVLPRSWIAKACGRNRDDARLFLAPLKWLGSFAAVSYCVALVAFLAPNRWNLDQQLMFPLCPLYFVKMTFDPSLAMTFLLFGPMNAGVYGAVGLIFGCGLLAFGNRRPS